MRVVGLRIGLSLLAGAFLFLAVPTYGLWPLMWIAAVPEIYVARVAATPKRAFLYGWLTGAVAHTGGFYWMDGLLERFGHMAPIEALPIMALLIAYQGLAFAFFSWGVRRAWDRTGAPLVLLAPLVMVAVELLMPQIFPYYLAISQAFVPAVIQIADVTGPLGVTALMLAFAGAVADAIFAASRRSWPAWRAPVAVGPADRRRPRLRRAADAPGRRASRCRAQGAHGPRAGQRRYPREVGSGGVRAPPGPAPARLGRSAARRRRAGGLAGVVVPVRAAANVRARLRDPTTAAWCGAGSTRSLHVRRPHPRRKRHRKKGPDRYPYNTAIMMDAAGNATGSYDKVFLMMFGEYVPFYDQIPWFTEIFPEASNFSRGSEPASFPLHTAAGDFKLGPLICYEDILPSFARRVAKLGPNAFVNITNDAWFGRTAEPYQHLALAVFRAVEHRLEMVRAVNTGVSAHIDAAGPRSPGDRIGRSQRPAGGAAQDAARRPGHAPRRRPLPDGGRSVRVSLPAVPGRPPGLEGWGTGGRALGWRRRRYERRRKNRYLKSCRSCLKAGKRISFATSIAQVPVGVPAKVDPTWTDCTVPFPPTT